VLRDTLFTEQCTHSQAFPGPTAEAYASSNAFQNMMLAGTVDM